MQEWNFFGVIFLGCSLGSHAIQFTKILGDFEDFTINAIPGCLLNNDEYEKLLKCNHVELSFKQEYSGAPNFVNRDPLESKFKRRNSQTKLYPKYVRQVSRFVHLRAFRRPQLLFERAESFLTGQDLYNNLSRSQIDFLTKQHENDPQKLQNSDVNDFENWKRKMWNTWYKNMNFVIEKWDTEIIPMRHNQKLRLRILRMFFVPDFVHFSSLLQKKSKSEPG